MGNPLTTGDTGAPALRLVRLDVARGLAVAWMTAFHFAFDLSHAGWWPQDFLRDPVWTLQRTAIVSLFLLCAGVGQAVAVAQGQPWKRFWRRWAQVGACALLVTAGSYLLFPRSFIYFGVLHGLAVMLVVARLTAGWGRWLWLAGSIAAALPVAAAWAHGAGLAPAWLDGPAFNWLGLVGRKPVTEDYVPLAPWLGVVWWGTAAGQWLLRARPQWLSGPAPAALAWAGWLGRHSLPWYMLHQPVLLGLLAAWAALAGGRP
jgi:uncharacterized membrane protein